MDLTAKKRRNVEINAERAARQQAKEERREVTSGDRNKYRKFFSKYTEEADRRRNIKRGVK